MEVRKNRLERHFSTFRRNVIGAQQLFESPFGKKEIIYADWTASGRAYRPIEECMQQKIMPFLANTHTETTITGTLMSVAYQEAKDIVKSHVNADGDDVLIFCGNGMTGAVNKLQRILGWRAPERFMKYVDPHLDEEMRPVVFVTHMEHHSNQISWLETIATVEIIQADKNGNVDLEYFRSLLEQFKHRKIKIAAVTACSNVTGIQTPYPEIAKTIHEYGGLCFVDFACSAPYVGIDMHPAEKGAHLDAIYFSPHKFLGGPGTPGVLIFTKQIYKNTVPDQPGGGTVVYSNPWKAHEYVENIEQREDGGTPPFLGGIKVAMCVRLKECMGVGNMLKREEEMLSYIFKRFARMDNVEILEGGITKRLGVVSFIIAGAHHNLVVKMLNDRFGIQTRGGCSCAGTYGHKLLNIDKRRSYEILDRIRSGDLLCKPGWIRLSVHPTMTDAEIALIMDAIESTACHYQDWMRDYINDPRSDQYSFRMESAGRDKVEDWFTVSSWGKSPDHYPRPRPLERVGGS
jgi:selenocysteine lyase/cysteine desulfurase